MEVRLLGKVGVYLHDGERPLPSSGPRCVLAALALNPGKPVPADRLVNCVWLPSKQTDSSLETLARYAGHVDKAIREAGGDPKSLEYDSRDRTYTLNVAPSEVDYHQFGELYAEARQRQIPELFDRAAALWKGEPLADVEGSWAGNRRLDLQNEFRRFQHERFQALIKAGQADRVFREIVELVEHAPEDAFLTDGALALAELDRRAEIPPWIERFTRLCNQIKEAPPHPEAVAEARRLSSSVRGLGGSDGEFSQALMPYRHARTAPEDAPAADKSTSAWHLDPAFRRHWEPRSRGVERASHGGWYFTGRSSALRELVGSLSISAYPASPVVTVVTGSPGSGKSAVLARLVVTTYEHYRAQIPASVLDQAQPGTVAAVGQVAAAVHAAGKTTAQVAAQIGTFLGLPDIGDQDDLIDALHDHTWPGAVVLDALDEAVHPRELARELLAPLIRNGQGTGLRMIIGTRRELRAHLRTAQQEIDLDKAEYFSATDVSDYIAAYLLADSDPTFTTPYRGRPELATTIAQEAAAKAGKSFLIAQLVALDLVQRPTVVGADTVAFPSTVSDAMERYLASAGEAMHRRGILSFTPEACTSWVRDLLRPLAFSHGDGLPNDDVWAELATRLGVGTYSAQDVRKLRDDTPAAALLRAVEAAGLTSWSLFHEALAEYLRHDAIRLVGNESDIHRSFVDILLSNVDSMPTGQRDWSTSDSYTRTNLAEHATRARRLDELVVDPGFLLATDRDRILPLLTEVATEKALAAAHVYELAGREASDGTAVDSATMLTLTARLHGVDWLADAVRELQAVKWDVPWTQWLPPGRHRRLPDHSSATTAVTMGAFAGITVVVTGAADGTIRLWELGTSEMVGDPLVGHTKSVTSLVCGQLDDRAVVISASLDGSVRIWDAMTGQQIGDPLTEHTGPVHAVALGVINGQQVAVSGGADGDLRVWDITAGAPLGEPLPGHAGGVNAVIFTELNSRAVAISGGADGAVRLWDLCDRTALGEPLEDHTGTVNAVAVARHLGDVVVISGATDHKIRLWRLGSAQVKAEVLTGHDGWINAFAVTTLDSVPVVVSVSNDRTVRVWDVLTGAALSTPRTGHRLKATGVTTTVLNGRATAITTSTDRSVRLWDLTARTTKRSYRTVHTGGINAIATDGSNMAITVSNDRTAQVWHLTTGAPFGTAIKSHGSFQSVAVATRTLGALLVTGNRDGAVETWDLTSRTALVKVPAAHVGKVNGVAVIEISGTECIASGGDDKALRIWRTSDGKQVGEYLKIHKGAINALATATVAGIPLAVTASNDRTVRAWDLRTGDQFGHDLTDHGDWIRAVGVAEVNGRILIVSGCNDRIVRVWDLTTGALRHRLEGHTGSITSVATGVVHGHATLATVANDGTLRLWDQLWRTGGVPIVIDVGSPIQSVAITSTGAVVIAGPAGVACLAPDSIRK
ncbi:BTAD domain-containing putative transcriptional regulator [Amycolatopsis orientalis]|uniref:BTAD domain-containing putative transcriptional regulator n=1 Tax=Amycolatopsis orientalis TaxID=31958 RepID=UPI0003FCB234|nr:BTAD domain-containing putative transcriptional regulator [Amycolatopsis orientalis]